MNTIMLNEINTITCIFSKTLDELTKIIKSPDKLRENGIIVDISNVQLLNIIEEVYHRVGYTAILVIKNAECPVHPEGCGEYDLSCQGYCR